MSWYNETKMACTNCGEEYSADVSTLTIATKEYKDCPNCKKMARETLKEATVE